MAEVFTGGRWVDCLDAIDVVNPYTGETVGQAGRLSGAGAVEAARHARAHLPHLTAYDRAEVLHATARAVTEDTDGFAASIVAESGLALKDARREVDRAATLLRFCAEEALRLHGETLPTDVTSARQQRLAVTVRQPLGLVFAVTPFNRPLNQVVNKFAPAFAAGNSVLLKPSEKTPLTALRFLRAALASGVPADSVALVTGDPAEVVDAVLDSETPDMVTFTGSTAVGRRIARAMGMCRGTFELGDSGALIVLPDADLTAAAAAAAGGAFSTSGQSCRGVKRILAHVDVADELARLIVGHASALTVGDPSSPATDIGTLISEDAARAAEARVEDAVRRGADVLCGGKREGAQYWPTVVDNVPRDADLVVEETFAPCAPIVRVRDFDDAVACVNATRYGLQTGLFTQRLDLALRGLRELAVGTVVVNGGPQFESVNIPFGGVKDSGLGREGARYAIEEMSTVRTLVL